MKSVASLFARQERKPNLALEPMVTPTQALIAGVVVMAIAMWPLLTVQFGRPTSWFGNFLLLLCATLSVFAPASLCLVTLLDIVRRRADARLIAAFVLSLAGTAAIAAFIYLQIHQYGSAA